jgi:hypothetical protein
MPRSASTFKQADVFRAGRAARAAGVEIGAIEITRDGTIRILDKANVRAPEAPTPYDSWKAEANGSR